MLKKLLALTLAACLLMGALILTAMAEGEDANGLVLIFEENFDEYEAEVNVGSTTMPSFFICDYNPIGDGVINIQETADGNLYLFSHVFTQIYTDIPLVGSYEFSMDVYDAQGTAQSGVLIRAPKTDAAYYEGDGHPNTSVCLSGLFLYPHGNSLGVNVKTYDAAASSTAYLQNNTVEFPLPEGTGKPYNLRVMDNGEEISIYVNDTLICRVTMSDPGKTYANHQVKDPCFGSAKLYDAEGNELGAYTDTLIGSTNAVLGWTTRAANMSVDNVKIMGEQAYTVLRAIKQLPSQIDERNLEEAAVAVAEARALYDALPEEKKALVTNLSSLTKAEETVAELEAATDAPTEAPTGAPTEPVTDPVTEEPTEEPTVTTAEPDASTPTDTAADTAEDTGENTGDNTEVKVIDDSLAVWILIAVMIVAVCATAGFITVKVRK